MKFNRVQRIMLCVLSVSLVIILILIPVYTISRAEEKPSGKEFHAVWISYLEFNSRLKDPTTGKTGFTEKRFDQMIDDMFDQVSDMKMNAVVVQVRPFGDAFYPSKYFPWSKYLSGTEGKNPGFDPLKYMIKAAHKRGLKFHAWINPYRITSSSTDVSLLSSNNMARKWRTGGSKADCRKVLTFGGALYYNPSYVQVQNMIRSGVKEIVQNYDVDGIHFDDYFYPNLGKDYKNNFDAPEYLEYKDWCRNNRVSPSSIADWRRNNVNKLVKNVYQDIKKINKNVKLGISPGGYLDTLSMDDRYYSDIKTWLSKSGYIDYICPQLYWTFSNPTYPFDKIVDRWIALRTNKAVKIYVGIAVYRAGSNLEEEWKNDAYELKKQVEYGRKTKKVDGYLYFRYDFFFHKTTQKAVKQLLNIL